METMYILLVAAEMQLKATAIVVPRDTTEESSATVENQIRVIIAYERGKNQTTQACWDCVWKVHAKTDSF